MIEGKKEKLNSSRNLNAKRVETPNKPRPHNFTNYFGGINRAWKKYGTFRTSGVAILHYRYDLIWHRSTSIGFLDFQISTPGEAGGFYALIGAAPQLSQILADDWSRRRQSYCKDLQQPCPPHSTHSNQEKKKKAGVAPFKGNMINRLLI